MGQNKTLSKLEPLDVLGLFKKDLLINFNCHAIAKVDSFDPIKQRVNATMTYKQLYYATEEKTSSSVPFLRDYPALLDCPVVVMNGGNASLRMPIKPGDFCIILFNDRDMDAFVTEGTINGPPDTGRLHSFSDGIALVGIKPFSSPLQDYEADRAELINGDMLISLSEEKLKIENATRNLKALIDSLHDVLITLTAAMSAATPANVTATVGVPSAAAQTSLTTLKGQFGELLE